MLTKRLSAVAVFVLVTEGTLEENLLTTLSSKRELAMAALDAEARGGRSCRESAPAILTEWSLNAPSPTKTSTSA